MAGFALHALLMHAWLACATRKCVRMLGYAYMRTHTHTHAYMHTLTYAHIRARVSVHACTPTHTHTRTHAAIGYGCRGTDLVGPLRPQNAQQYLFFHRLGALLDNSSLGGTAGQLIAWGTAGQLIA